MSISLLKRYRNEVKAILSKTKKCIKDEWGDDFEIFFNIKSPYAAYDYDLKSGISVYSKTLRVNKIFENKWLVDKIRAVEDNGLVYFGVDLDRTFVEAVIKSYFEDSCRGDIDSFISKKLIRKVIWEREKYKFREYASKNGNSLTDYNSPLLLGNIETYADYGLMAKKNDDGKIEFVDPGYVSKVLDDFISNNLSIIKNLNYFKVCRKEIDSFFSNLSIKVAEGEFPKLNNRNFLPIVTVNFNKNELSYLFRSNYVNRKVSFPAYTKGLMKIYVETFLYDGGGGSYIIPPTNTLVVEYRGEKCRCNDSSILNISFSVD